MGEEEHCVKFKVKLSYIMLFSFLKRKMSAIITDGKTSNCIVSNRYLMSNLCSFALLHVTYLSSIQCVALSYF